MWEKQLEKSNTNEKIKRSIDSLRIGTHLYTELIKNAYLWEWCQTGWSRPSSSAYP